MPAVNPLIMKWARETAGFDHDEAAQKLGIKDARGIPAAQRLELIERGDTEPSRSMLIRMSKQYKRPLIAFYMSSVPRTADTGQDFRTLPETVDALDNARVAALLRDVHARQGIVKSVLEDAEEDDVLSFVGSYSIDNRPEEISAAISTLLDFDRTEYRQQKSPEKAFELLRSKVEKAGIYVLLIGDLGNYRSAIPVEAFRGFAIADNIVPFIIINDQDAKSAWAFTLLHELAHIFLGETGVSNAFIEQKTEQFCNQVASEFLVPETDFAGLGITDDTELKEAMDKISKIAADLNVSSSMIGYRLMLDGCIGREMWQALSGNFRELWLQNKSEFKAKRKGKGGPDYFVVRRHRVGGALVRFSDRMIQSGILTTTKAAKVLGVKPNNVQPLLDYQ